MTTRSQLETIGSLSEEQRLKQIAEILCDAILVADRDGTLAAERDRSAEVPSTETPPASPRQLPADEQRVVDYLARVSQAPPLALRALLGLPRTSAYRVLNRLIAAGHVVTGGQTRRLIYRLNPLPPRKQNVELN
jgi:uncharacterized membrane protein